MYSTKNSFKKFLALVLAVVMTLGVCPLTAFAKKAEKPQLNYVSLGASNANGYGMRGYLPYTVYDAPWTKGNANIYGYQMQVENSYPDLIADYYENQGYNVIRNELAMSSMRAEEVRFLLDDSYTGDAYTDWRFVDVDGYPSKSDNWFIGAGRLELNKPNADAAEAVTKLKEAYRDYIRNADLITVDIGINNFGVYVSNQIVSNKYENDLAKIAPEYAEKYAEGKAYAKQLLGKYVDMNAQAIGTEALENIADTMAYALVGFCISFDAVMDKIYELNPDATVVVVSIQNLMSGLNATLPGGITIPFGDLFGALINTANVYIATNSPHANDYLFADVRKSGRVEFFSDEILGYNGDPTTLSQDMKDCFDVYDDDLLIKTRIQKFLYETVSGKKIADKDFVNALASKNEVYNAVQSAINGDYKNKYERALNTAYDVIAEIMQAGVAIDALDVSSFGKDFGKTEDDLLDIIFGTLLNAVSNALEEDDYSFSLSQEYPGGFFETIAEGLDLDVGFVKTIASMGIRTGIGNSFYGHPNANGHEQIKNAILATLENGTTGKDVITNEIKIAGEQLYRFAYDHGAESLVKVVNFVAGKGYITDEQAAALDALIAAADKAIKTGDTEELLAVCEEIAQDLYTYAVANGKVPEEVQKAVNEFFRIYDEMKDLTPEQQKAYTKAMLEDLAEKYGPEALEKLNEYVLSLDVLDERQLGELEAKIWDFINAYPDAPDATIDAAIDELVDFLFEITVLDKDKVMEMYEYLTTTSREQMIEDAAELMQKYLDKYGPEALKFVENYLIEEGYVTAEEIAEITKQVELAIAAYEAQDKATMKASCDKLAELVYAYADEKGYIPAEVKEAYAKAIELYNEYGKMTPEEIKALAVAELKKFVTNYKAEALVALQTYVVNEGWLTKAENIKELAEKIAAAIAAYEADPEGVTEKAIKDLVNYIYNKAVAEGCIDPAKVEELNKFLDMVKGACTYFATTSEEQMKADAIAYMFAELDKLTDGKMNAEVYAKVKADIAELIAKLENIKPEDIQAVVNAYIESIKTKYLALIDDATHGKYVPNSESYYVALGGDTVYGTGIGKYDDGYYDLLLAELGLDGKTQYKNLGVQNLDPTEVLEYIEKNKDEIAKADLITYQMDATAFVIAALNEEDPDWSKYLTEEQIAFIEEAIPVIIEILNDDWTKYADLDANKIVDDIKSDVFGAIDDAIMDAFNGQADKLDELLGICVAQVKSYVEYIQENAVELYVEAVLSEAVLYHSLMEPVYEVLNENWASYADLDVKQIVSEIESKVLAKAGEVESLSKEKINELLERCVEKALELHEYADAEIEKLPEYFSDEELAFAQAAFEFVWEYAVEQWPELAELDVEELHEKAYTEIMKLLNKADNFNYEQYADLGAEKIEEILNCCVDKAMDAIEDIQSEAVETVMVIDNAEAKFLEEAFKFAFDYLVEDWGTYVDKSAAWISNQIKDAVIAEMYKYSNFGKEYIDQYADDFAAILTTCIEEVQNVLQTAQNKKDEVLNALNAIEPYKEYIEKLLFASVAYAVDTVKAVDAIQEINPGATLIVVGMYNPLNGLEIVMNGETVNVGEYVEYLVGATNVYYTALAVADGEFTFVAVPETEINGFENAINVDELNVAQLGTMLLKLNDSMYADANGHEYIFEQIMGALDTTDDDSGDDSGDDAPTVDNRTKETAGTFDAVVNFEDNNKTAVVECNQACVVLAAKVGEDGKVSYTRLTGKKNQTTGAYEFDLSGVSGEFTLTVALKGDYNLDGTVTTNDVAQANKALVNHTDPSELQNYVFDMTGDDAISTNDVAKVNKSVVNKTAIEW